MVLFLSRMIYKVFGRYLCAWMCLSHFSYQFYSATKRESKRKHNEQQQQLYVYILVSSHKNIGSTGMCVSAYAHCTHIMYNRAKNICAKLWIFIYKFSGNLFFFSIIFYEQQRGNLLCWKSKLHAVAMCMCVWCWANANGGRQAT